VIVLLEITLVCVAAWIAIRLGERDGALAKEEEDSSVVAGWPPRTGLVDPAKRVGSSRLGKVPADPANRVSSSASALYDWAREEA
jgi:hypothetical protein